MKRQQNSSYFWLTFSFYCCCFYFASTLVLYAQFLEKDTSNIEQRYPDIVFTKNSYTFAFEKVDTSLQNFHILAPAQKNADNKTTFEDAFLGNLGQAHFSQVFDYQRNTVGLDLGFRHYDRYLFHAKDITYFNTPYPFARFEYNFGQGENQLLSATFAQTIQKNFHYTLDYRRIIGSEFYQRQQASYHNFVANTWWHTPNKRYNILTHILANAASIEQSGGIDTLFEDQYNDIGELDTLIQRTLFVDTSVIRNNVLGTNLENATTTLSDRQFYIQQSYDLGKSYLLVEEGDTPEKNDTTDQFLPQLRIGHAFTYQKNNYLFDDQSPDPNYYNSFFRDKNKLEQAPLYQIPFQLKDYKNEVFAVFLGYKKDDFEGYVQNSTAKVSLTQHFYEVQQNTRLDTVLTQSTINAIPDTNLVGRAESLDYQSTILAFNLANKPLYLDKKLKYRAKAQYALLGYNAGDMVLEGHLKYQFSSKIGGIRGFAHFSRLSPDHIQQRWFGNHFVWNNDFGKTTALQLKGTYFNPSIKLESTYANYTFDNYLIWNEEGQPQQLDKPLNISQFIINKNFKFKSFKWENTLVYQIASNDSIAIPKFWSRHRFYFEDYLFNNALFSQIGLDIRYNSDYFVNSFSPQTSQFYFQNTNELSYYPTVDLFISFRVSRVRIYGAVRHLNQGLFIQKGYYAAPFYPMPDRSFNIGLSWLFFD